METLELKIQQQKLKALKASLQNRKDKRNNVSTWREGARPGLAQSTPTALSFFHLNSTLGHRSTVANCEMSSHTADPRHMRSSNIGI